MIFYVKSQFAQIVEISLAFFASIQFEILGGLFSYNHFIKNIVKFFFTTIIFTIFGMDLIDYKGKANYLIGVILDPVLADYTKFLLLQKNITSELCNFTKFFEIFALTIIIIN